jgi:hypothetical protein
MRDGDAETVKRLFPHVSAATREANPHIYGAGSGAVAGPVRASQPERDKRSQIEDSGVEAGKGGVESSYRVTLTVFRRRLCDNHDNARTALKPVVDNVTAWLGFKTDDHQNLYWEYHQEKTLGRCGTLIVVERVCNIK